MVSPYERVKQADQHVLSHALLEAAVRSKRPASGLRMRDQVSVVVLYSPKRVVSDLLSDLTWSATDIAQVCLGGHIVDT